MRALIQRFLNDSRGATAIEYAVVLGIIALMMVGALTLFSVKIAGTFNTLSTTLQ